MNIGLVIGKKNSMGVPGKNIKTILGRPAAEYAFIAAKYSTIDKVYVSTDSDEIASIGKPYNAIHIKRPDKLATPEALTEDALLHAYDAIKKDLGSQKISTISLLFCNNPAINVEITSVEEIITDISIISFNGQFVQNIFKGKIFNSTQTISWEPNNLSSGIYLVRLTNDKNKSRYKKITYLK